MKFAIGRYLTFGAAILGIGGIVAVSPPAAFAEGGAGGSGNATVTGPGGTSITSVSGALDGVENIPGGAPGTLGCITGGCTAGLTTVGSVVTGSGSIPPPAGLQITPTVNLPQPSITSCITAQCHGNGGLSIGGGV